MNNKIITAILVFILVLAGVFVLANNGDDESESSNNEAASSSDESPVSNTDNQLGIDTGALQGDYRLTVTSNANGEEIISTFEVDSDGNISTSSLGETQTGGLIYLDGTTYVQNPEDGTWISYPAGASGAPSISADDLGLSNDELNEISDNSKLEDLGTQDCVSGTCRVYRDADAEAMETSLIKVDTATNRLSEVEVTDTETGDVTTIRYEYEQNIVITAPEGATQLEIPSFQ